MTDNVGIDSSIANRTKLFNINKYLIVSDGAAKSSLLQFIADVTKKHICLTKLKDKTVYEVLKVLLNHLGKA